MEVRIIEPEKLELFRAYIASDLFDECMGSPNTFALCGMGDGNVPKGIAICRLGDEISEIADISIWEGTDYLSVYAQLLKSVSGILKDEGVKALALTLYDTPQREDIIRFLENMKGRVYSEDFMYTSTLLETGKNLENMGAGKISSNCTIKPYESLLSYEVAALKSMLLKMGFNINRIPNLNGAISMVWLGDGNTPRGCILVSDDLPSKALGVEYLYTDKASPKETILLMRHAIKAAIKKSYKSDTIITAVAADKGKGNTLEKLFGSATETALNYVISL